MRVRNIFFFSVILKFWPYLNIGCKGILEQKNMVQTGGSLLNSNIDKGIEELD